jgi:hypothetical protein
VTTPVRSPLIPQTHIPAGGANTARAAGQRAFFEAAMGKASASAAATPDAPARFVPKVPVDLPAEPPTRILRPGSLLDIKV